MKFDKIKIVSAAKNIKNISYVHFTKLILNRHLVGYRFQ